MPSSVSDLQAANQLKISLQTITKAQAWSNQIRGAYTLLYPWMTGDFVHLEDFKAWLRLYKDHIHGNGNNGSPTTKPQLPAPFNTQKAQSHNRSNAAVGKLRDGFSAAEQLISELTQFKKRDV